LGREAGLLPKIVGGPGRKEDEIKFQVKKKRSERDIKKVKLANTRTV